MRGASALASPHDRTADDPAAGAQRHHRVHPIPQHPRSRPLPGLGAPLHTRPGACASSTTPSASECRRGGRWLQLAITDLDDRLMGDVAVWLDDDEQLAMIGYTLAPEYQGRGYRRRSGRCHRSTGCSPPARCTAWRPRSIRTTCASARVLERNGFRYIGTARVGGSGPRCLERRRQVRAARQGVEGLEAPARSAEAGRAGGDHARDRPQHRRDRSRLLATPIRLQRVPVVRRRAGRDHEERRAGPPVAAGDHGRPGVRRVHDGGRADGRRGRTPTCGAS